MPSYAGSSCPTDQEVGHSNDRYTLRGSWSSYYGFGRRRSEAEPEVAQAEANQPASVKPSDAYDQPAKCKEPQLWVQRLKNGLSVEQPVPSDELRVVKRVLRERDSKIPRLFLSERRVLTARASFQFLRDSFHNELEILVIVCAHVV